MDSTLEIELQKIAHLKPVAQNQNNITLLEQHVNSTVGVDIIGNIPYETSDARNYRDWFKFLGGVFLPKTNTWNLRLIRSAWTTVEYNAILTALHQKGCIKSITEIFVLPSINDISITDWSEKNFMVFSARYEDRELLKKTIPGVRWDSATSLWFCPYDVNILLSEKSTMIDCMGWFVGMKPSGTSITPSAVCQTNLLDPITETHVLIHPTARRGIAMSSHPNKKVVAYTEYILSEKGDSSLIEILHPTRQVLKEKAKSGWERLISNGYLPLKNEIPAYPDNRNTMGIIHEAFVAESRGKYNALANSKTI